MDAFFCLDDSPFFEFIELQSIDSTNNFLRSYHPIRERRMTVVTAEHQLQGRGQAGNSWESEEGKNLLCSISIRPKNIKASEVFVLSQAISVAIKMALEDYLQPVHIKWPNDIYYQDHKLGGILIENELAGDRIARCIIGLGININQTEFVSDAPNPISMKQILGKDIERRFVLERIVGHFDRLWNQIERGDVEALQSIYLQSLYKKDEVAVYCDAQGEFQARIEGVLSQGLLQLRDNDNQLRSYEFKEVSLVLPKQ